MQPMVDHVREALAARCCGSKRRYRCAFSSFPPSFQLANLASLACCCCKMLATGDCEHSYTQATFLASLSLPAARPGLPPFRFRGLDDIKESVAEAAVGYSKTVANISVRLCDPYNFVPSSSGGGAEGDTAAAAAAAARNDAGGDGPDAVRQEAGEARRAIGTMLDDLRASEAEARARGEEGTMDDPAGGGGGGGALGTAEGRDGAADEVLRQVLEREQGAGEGAAGGVGRVLGGRRNGPTVDEILRPGRAGAGRNASAPPPTEAARAAAAGAVGVTLPWLLRKGILSRCKPSQALAMRTLQRLVKVCDKEALMPHLAELVATLIEGLSALEPQVGGQDRQAGRR